MSKKFKDIQVGDKIYVVEPGFDKCEILIYTVKEISEPINDKEVMIFTDEPNHPWPWFLPKESTSKFDLLFTSEEDARTGMLRQINQSISYHKDIIKKYKQHLKHFER